MSFYKEKILLKKMSIFYFLLAVASACAENLTDEFNNQTTPIIGGFRAASPSLNSVGALVVVNKDMDNDSCEEEYQVFCTATLIGPSTILTARHCVPSSDMSDIFDIRFAIGPNLDNPLKTVTISGWSAVLDEIDNESISSDIAVAHLSESVDDIEPLPLAPLTEEDIGRRFISIGYGIQNNQMDNGIRMAGSITLRGLSGTVYQTLFSDFENFKTAVISDILTSDGYSPRMDPIIQRMFDNSRSIAIEYEAVWGNAYGDAQPCHGDSGGPILAEYNNRIAIFGVNSAVPLPPILAKPVWEVFDPQLVCNWGVIGATFGLHAKDHILRELACPLMPVTGQCQGDTAIRCSDMNEGTRRIVETDCGILGLTCGLNQQIQRVECVDPYASNHL